MAPLPQVSSASGTMLKCSARVLPNLHDQEMKFPTYTEVMLVRELQVLCTTIAVI